MTTPDCWLTPKLAAWCVNLVRSLLKKSFESTDAFSIELATFPPKLVRIGQIAKKWQQLFEIQDCGSGLMYVYDVIITHTVKIERCIVKISVLDLNCEVISVLNLSTKSASSSDEIANLILGFLCK